MQHNKNQSNVYSRSFAISQALHEAFVSSGLSHFSFALRQLSQASKTDHCRFPSKQNLATGIPRVLLLLPGVGSLGPFVCSANGSNGIQGEFWDDMDGCVRDADSESVERPRSVETPRAAAPQTNRTVQDKCSSSYFASHRNDGKRFRSHEHCQKPRITLVKHRLPLDASRSCSQMK